MISTLRRGAALSGVVSAAISLIFCGQKNTPLSPSIPTNTTSAVQVSPSAAATPSGLTGTLVGAGDIGMCGMRGAESTARLLDRLGGTVFTAGDNAYMSGTIEEYRNCYEPSWGRHRSRTRPVPGNHEYERGSGGAGYFTYFGLRAGQSGLGYYSFTEGPWHVVALNSEMPSGSGSTQMQWLRDDLGSNRTQCTAVIWHRPLFSSGRNGDNADMRDVWRTLYDYNVDIVINGHDHTYERFAPQDADGRPDRARGIREFIVGTGGAPLYEFPTVHTNSEVRAAAWGVLQLQLTDANYQWQFVPIEGESFQDSGSDSCH